MSITNVGANLVFALRTKTELKPMFENELETLASGIGLQTIVVRRANIRFAPTLVSDIGWISITTIYPKIYDRLLNKVRPTNNTLKQLTPENNGDTMLNSKTANMSFLKSKNIDIKDESLIKHFKKDDIIFQEGQPGYEAYYIKKGTVNIYRLSANKRILLACLQSGEIFGEMSILSGEVRNANAIANDNVTLVVIEKNILTSTMNETLPMVQSLAISLIKRLNNSNQKINEKPSNNTLLTVCTILHLMVENLVAKQGAAIGNLPQKRIRYYDLCSTIKDIVPLSEVDIDHVLDHLVRHGYIKVFSEKTDQGHTSKWILIGDENEFNAMIQKVKSSGGWGIENDPFIQNQEFIDLMDFSQMMNTSPENLINMLANEDIPHNLLFLHRTGVASWMEKRQKKKLYRRLYDSPFGDVIKKDKSWVA